MKRSKVNVRDREERLEVAQMICTGFPKLKLQVSATAAIIFLIFANQPLSSQTESIDHQDNNEIVGKEVQSPAQSKLVSVLQKRLQTNLDKIVADEKFPGATLAVVLKDGTLIEMASGFADPEAKTKMPIDGKMFCGSTGKTFVSAVALKLVDDEKLELDAKAIKYFDGDERDWFAKLPNAEEITVRSLMNHTSGLPRYLFQKDYLADLKANPMKSRSPREGLQALHGKAPTHSVGNGWSYSDSNYLVLGLIIEKITGRQYYDIAKEWILDPLKLDNTVPATQPKLEGLIQGHIGSTNLFDLPKKTIVDGQYVMNPNFEWCGGGYITTSGDLARWMHALHTGEVISKRLYWKLVSPVDFKTGQKPNYGVGGYGLGTFVWLNDRDKFYGHAGIMPGYLTQIEFSTRDGFAIALQTNTDEGLGRRHHDLVQEIAAVVTAELEKKRRFELEKALLNQIKKRDRQKKEAENRKRIEKTMPRLHSDSAVLERLEYDGGSFERIRGEKTGIFWVETKSQDGSRYVYEETSRSTAGSFIFDRDRNIHIRLSSRGGRALISKDKQRSWQHLCDLAEPSLENAPTSLTPEKRLELEELLVKRKRQEADRNRIPFLRKEVKKVFETCDKNNDGQLSVAELKAANGLHMKYADKNEDEIVDKDELFEFFVRGLKEDPNENADQPAQDKN